VSPSRSPLLETLATDRRPAWLWDPDRLRMIWSNHAGIAFWRGDSLFDILDRRFDIAEPGVNRAVELARSLRPDTSVEEDFTFPSSGRRDAIRFRCALAALNDGRQGLLMVAETAPRGSAAARPDPALDLLPLPVAVFDMHGGLVARNQAALEIIPADGADTTALAALVGSPQEAGDLIARVAEAGTVSEVRTIATPFGERIHRINARHVSDTPETVVVMFDDITERRAHERDLIAERERLADFVQAACDFTFELDADLTWTALADGFETATGIAAGALVGRTWAETAARFGFDRDGRIAALCRGRRPWSAETVWSHEGRSARIALSAHPASATAGGYRGIGSVIQAAAQPALAPAGSLDEHDRETFQAIGEVLARAPDAPAAVAEPEDPYGAVRGILDTARVGLIVHRDRKVLYANPRAAELIGVEPAALAGTDDLASLFEGAFEMPDDGRETATLVALAGEAALAAHASAIDWDDGEATLVQIEPAPRPAARAVGPREAELEAILNTATDGIITLDKDGRIVTLNASGEAILGYDSEDVQGRELVAFLTPDSARTVSDYLDSLADSGLASIFNDGREVVIVEKHGGHVPVFLTLGRMKGEGDETGSGVTFCAVVRDITQWKKAEADLRRAKETAERGSLQKSEFLARISHELRTPLNAIIGFSEVMAEEKFGPLSNERYSGYVNDIHTSGQHLLSLINDLLDLSKVEAGKLELNFTSVNLADIIQQCVGIMQPQANRERIIIRSSMAPKLPPVVADQRSMRQIVLNLLSNAIKFTDPGGQVIISALMDEAGRVQVRVKDTGIGMNADELKRALEPFRQIKRPGRNEHKGTGLGLPLTKALAEANRAEFSIRSEPDQGTLVEITFPTTRVLAD
jgi:PAS domain S-box-containing protein